jgi:hypothetical protein
MPLFEFFINTTTVGHRLLQRGCYRLICRLSIQLRNFMQTLPIHPQTHPPGLIVLHWLVWRGFMSVPDLANSLAMPLRALQCQNAALMSLDNAQLASAVIGMIVPIAGGFTVWPLYALGRRLIGARQAALAAAIFPVLPMFVMWPAQWDQVFPPVSADGLYFIHTVWSPDRPAFRVGGIVFSCATFLNFGNMIIW